MLIKLRVTGGIKTNTPGRGAQSVHRALACSGIGHIGENIVKLSYKKATFYLDLMFLTLLFLLKM